MNKDEEQLAVGILAVAGILVGVPFIWLPFALLNGWVLTRLWMWFAVEPYRLPQISIWTAMAITLAFRQLTYTYAKDDRKFSIVLLTSVTAPLVTLGFGWVIHAFAR